MNSVNYIPTFDYKKKSNQTQCKFSDNWGGLYFLLNRVMKIYFEI